jgi:hypothetical protein
MIAGFCDQQHEVDQAEWKTVGFIGRRHLDGVQRIGAYEIQHTDIICLSGDLPLGFGMKIPGVRIIKIICLQYRSQGNQFTVGAVSDAVAVRIKGF